MCLFDGDTFIDGLPYRTAELDRTNAQYGGTSPTLALFEGNWELRIAFADFALAPNFDVAYPAVGGYFQFAVGDCGGDDDDSACSWRGGEEAFAPCPHAAECSSQFVRGEYYSDCAVAGVMTTPCVDDYELYSANPTYCVYDKLVSALQDWSYWDSLVDDSDESNPTIDNSVLSTVPDTVISASDVADLQAYCKKTLGLCAATDDDAASVTDDAVRWSKAGQWLKCYVHRFPSPTGSSSESLYGYVNPNVYPFASYPEAVYSSLFSSNGFNYSGSSPYGDWWPPKGLISSDWGYGEFGSPTDTYSTGVYGSYSSVGDGVCDANNNNIWFQYDGGDCCYSTCACSCSAEGENDDAYCCTDCSDAADQGTTLTSGRCFGPAAMVEDAPVRYTPAVDDWADPSGYYYYYWDDDDDDDDEGQDQGPGNSPAPSVTLSPTFVPSPGPSYSPTPLPSPIPTPSPSAIADLARWDYCLKFGDSSDLGAQCVGSDVKDGSAVWKYPFTMWKAMLDVMQYYGADSTGDGDSIDMTSIPSMACPDCSVAKSNESYLSIKFALDLTTTLANVSEPATIDQTTAAGQDVTDAFPTLTSTRKRYIGQNVLLFGPLMYQKRYEQLGYCDVNSDYLLDYFHDTGCRDRDHFPETNSEVDYGVEATMNENAPQFLDSVQSGLYRTSNVGDSIPKGFEYNQGSGRAVKDVKYPFPVLFDINFNQSKAYQVVNAISEGLYIDGFTASLSMLFCTYNPDAGLWAMTTLNWTPQIGGTWDFNLEGNIVSLNRYYTDADWVRARARRARGAFCFCPHATRARVRVVSRSQVRFGIEIAFLIVLVYFVLVEIWEMVDAHRNSETGILAYFASLTNWVDLTVYTLMGAAIGVWCTVYFGTMLDALHPGDIAPRADVYQDFFASSHLLKMSADGQATYEAFFEDLAAVTNELKTYQLLISLALIGTVVQLVAKLAFHKQFGLISRTLDEAKSQLAFFFVLFIMITFIFTVLAYVLFGQYFSGKYGDIVSAFENTLLLIMTGLPSDYSAMHGTNAQLSFLTRIWYWLYILVIFFILMNAFLAIVVDAYANANQIPKTWREPLTIWFEYTKHRVAGEKGARALYLTNAQLGHALESLARVADDSAAEVSFASLEAATRAHAKLDAAPGKAGRILAQLTAAPGEVDGDDSIIVCVFGLRVDAPKLAGCFEHVLKLSSCAGGPDETRAIARVLAINVLVRVGVPSGELSEADLAGESDEDTKTKKKVVAAYALMF